MGGVVRTDEFPLLALLPGVRGTRGEEGAGSFHGVKVGVCPGARLEGWFSLFCPLLPWWYVQGACTVHCFYSLLFRSGSCFFGLSVSFCP